MFLIFYMRIISQYTRAFGMDKWIFYNLYMSVLVYIT